MQGKTTWTSIIDEKRHKHRHTDREMVAIPPQQKKQDFEENETMFTKNTEKTATATKTLTHSSKPKPQQIQHACTTVCAFFPILCIHYRCQYSMNLYVLRYMFCRVCVNKYKCVLTFIWPRFDRMTKNEKMSAETALYVWKCFTMFLISNGKHCYRAHIEQ